MAMQALIMGFGGTGAAILTALKDMTVVKYGAKPDNVQFMLFDTIADWQPGKKHKLRQGNAEETLAKGVEVDLDPGTEYFHLSDQKPALREYVYSLLSKGGDPAAYPHLTQWLNSPWLQQHIAEARLNISEGAAQQRQIGRFSAFTNVESIVQTMGNRLVELNRNAAGLMVKVWIVGSSAGGTGGGTLLDAAFLTRLAASKRAVRNLRISGVVVLPEVYRNVDGISLARAYALFRELERFQYSLPGSDTYSVDREEIRAHVHYRPAGAGWTAYANSKLFDDLFYLGRECGHERDRVQFFTSVANAVDPFLDDTSGPNLLQASMNRSGAASGIGAARLYVPVDTLSTIFAYDEALAFLRGATAARVSDAGEVSRVEHGSDADRDRMANDMVRRWLDLFNKVLVYSDRTENLNREYARNAEAISARKIVDEWCQFAAPSVVGLDVSAPERQAVRQAFANPFISLIQADEEAVDLEDQETTTYQENKKRGGVKESQEESRDRFARELEDRLNRYLDPSGGKGSFRAAKELVRSKAWAALQRKVDASVVDRMTGATGLSDGSVEAGTPITRLHRELDLLLAPGGPVEKIKSTLNVFIDELKAQTSTQEQGSVLALQELKDSRKTGFFAGQWVEARQLQARDELSDYVAWFQKVGLLDEVLGLVDDLEARLKQWRDTLRAAVRGLAWVEGTGSILENVRVKRTASNDRLNRLARNRSARISAKVPFDAMEGDTRMGGYVDELRGASIYEGDSSESLADLALAASRWVVSVENGAPSVSLNLRTAKQPDRSYKPQNAEKLEAELYARFRSVIDERLLRKDVFDYLEFLGKGSREFDSSALIGDLVESAKPLIEAEGGERFSKLVYHEPDGTSKVNLASALLLALTQAQPDRADAEAEHTDRQSLTVLRVQSPNLGAIDDIRRCRDDYLSKQTASLQGREDQDEELYRAQVYHAFRAEQEAWFIERTCARRAGTEAREYQIPPRITRLLDSPEMMLAFVHCVATGAIEKSGGKWLWHRSQDDVVELTTDSEPLADVVRAAVVFALQQREGRDQGLTQIRLKDARESAVLAAQSQQHTRDGMLVEFRSHRLDSFLQDHYRPGDGTPEVHEQEMRALRMIFDVYCDPETRASFRDRLNLV